MKFKKFLQKCFKVFFQKIFIFFHGKIKTLDNDEIYGVKKNVISEIKLDKIFNLEKKYTIYEIEKGRIYTDTVENVAIIKNNCLLPVSFQQLSGEIKNLKFNKVLSSGTPRIIKNFGGSVFNLTQGASGNNYFHFLFDILPKLKIYDQYKPFLDINYFYVPKITDWQVNIFSILGINSKKLIDSNSHRHVRADKILTVDHPWYYKGFVQNEVKNVPDWIIFWLREKFLHLSKKFNSCELIFIDRSESTFNHCKLQNNQEVIEFLEKKGFKSYKVGQLDFFEQIYLFQNAKTIIGPHGAAFTNLVFCEPKTNIIEIIPNNHPSQKCQRISNLLNLNYIRINVPLLKNQNMNFGDMLISKDKLNLLIKDLI